MHYSKSDVVSYMKSTISNIVNAQETVIVLDNTCNGDKRLTINHQGDGRWQGVRVRYDRPRNLYAEGAAFLRVEDKGEGVPRRKSHHGEEEICVQKGVGLIFAS